MATPALALAFHERLCELSAYQGWVPTDACSCPTTAYTDEATPEWFYREFVRERKPVILRDFAKCDAHNRAFAQAVRSWDLDELQKLVGDVSLSVECRKDRTNKFGEGKRQMVQFGKFVDMIRQGDETLYLTSDASDASEDYRGDAPVLRTRLGSSLPRRPYITGQLVPFARNLWVGRHARVSSEAEASTSGLHHDYHDNMYDTDDRRQYFCSRAVQ